MNKIIFCLLLLFCANMAFCQNQFVDATQGNPKTQVEDLMSSVKKREKDADKNFNRALLVYTKYEERHILKKVLLFSNGIEILCFASRQAAASLGKINGRAFINFYNNIPANNFVLFKESPTADNFFKFIQPFRVASY